MHAVMSYTILKGKILIMMTTDHCTQFHHQSNQDYRNTRNFQWCLHNKHLCGSCQCLQNTHSSLKENLNSSLVNSIFFVNARKNGYMYRANFQISMCKFKKMGGPEFPISEICLLTGLQDLVVIPSPQ